MAKTYMLHDHLSARNYFAEKHAGIEKVTKYNLFNIEHKQKTTLGTT
jgi:hypothetical protein